MITHFLKCLCFISFTPKKDENVISPYNIKTLLSSKVIRVKINVS